MEHSWIGNPFVNAVYTMIHNTPCRVAWLGDYAKSDAQGFSSKLRPGETLDAFYAKIWEPGGIKPTLPKEFESYDLKNFLTLETQGTFLINHTQKIYINMAEYISSNKFEESTWPWCINPLPLLTACANGDGGSYHGINMDTVGTWAFDELEYTDEAPAAEYQKATYHFKEGT